MKDVLAVILGGGRGTRLHPLTLHRSKPAVPIAGKYRLIDIPISNCLNSDLRRIFVLTQYNSERQNKHHFANHEFRDVLILAGDQLYHMDFARMLETHRRQVADVTVAVT